MRGKLIVLGMVASAFVAIAADRHGWWPQQSSVLTVQSAEGVPGPANRLAMISNLLGLNASQQEQARAIFDAEEAASKSLVDQWKEASDALGSAEKTAASEQELDQLAMNLANISGQLVAVDAKAEAKIYALLTAQQRRKLDQLPHPVVIPSAPLLPPRGFITGGPGLPR